VQDNKALKEAMAATSAAVEKQLDRILKVPDGPEARVFEAMRYSVFAGGKRLRPLLVLASAELFGVDRRQALRVAAALECVHCYSLIHDDLPAMDDDDLRRGKPTVHKQFDEATAILAGDALLTVAFEILADEDTHSDPYVRTELVKALAKASGGHGMVGGQMIDLSAADHDLDTQAIFRLQNMKTGALISFAAEAGAIMSHAGKHARAHLQGYARDLGLAFQIADDLLDVEGSEEETGKAVGKDEDAGKATIVGLLGVERARQQAEILADQAIEHLSKFDDKAALLRAIAHFAINRRS
jgi:farnesyl diphosphate synthase